MSRLPKPKARNQGGAWERIWSRMVGTGRRTPLCCKPRRLMLDQLEERTLLSVAPGGVSDTLVNQSLLTVPGTATSQVGNTGIILAESGGAALAGKSVATDNNGDFVVVWSQDDGVYDANGKAVIDSSTTTAMTDDNDTTQTQPLIYQ